MKRFIVLVAVLALSTLTAQTVKVMAVKNAAGGGGAFCTPFEECDQFNTTANPATGWTAGPSSGAWQTNGTQMVPPSGTVTATLNNTVAGTTTEYAIVKIAESGEESGVTLRRGNGETNYYRAYWSGTQAFWASHLNSTDAFNVESAGCSTVAFTDGDYMVALVTGINAATIVRIWNRGQTAPTAVPTTSDACGALCCEFLNDFVAYSNTGNQIGLYVYTTATVRRFDDFAGGGS